MASFAALRPFLMINSADTIDVNALLSSSTKRVHYKLLASLLGVCRSNFRRRVLDFETFEIVEYFFDILSAIWCFTSIMESNIKSHTVSHQMLKQTKSRNVWIQKKEVLRALMLGISAWEGSCRLRAAFNSEIILVCNGKHDLYINFCLLLRVIFGVDWV